MTTTTTTTTEQTRKVYSKEGTVVELSYGVINQSAYLRDLFPIEDEEDENDIPTLDISFVNLMKVKEYCEHYVIEPMTYLPKQSTLVRVLGVQPWYENWVNEVFESTMIDPDDPEYLLELVMWFELITVANKLELMQLFALLAKKFVIEKTNFHSHEKQRTELFAFKKVDGTRVPLPEIPEDQKEAHKLELQKNFTSRGYDDYWAKREEIEESEKKEREERVKALGLSSSAQNV